MIIKKMPLLLVVLMLLLTACSSKTFTFSGETDHWSAELKVTQTNDDYETQEFKLQFKGKDINSVGELTYNIETNAGGFGESGIKLTKGGFLIGKDEANPTNAKVIEDSEVKVTVEWNGNTETILLSKN
ncbi:hypothetical protein [Bacillus coreaensis]